MRSMTLTCLSTLILPLFAALAAAREEPPQLHVIVHPSNPVASLSRSQISNFLLKKVRKWDDGTHVRPVDQPDRSKAREIFNLEIHCRAGRAVTNYWQNQIFSGHRVPPPSLSSDEEVVAYVRGHPGAIGYVSGGASLDGVRAVPVKDD